MNANQEPKFEQPHKDYTDPRTFTDLPLTPERIDREKPAEYIRLQDGTYRLFYKPLPLYKYCPAELLENSDGKTYSPSVAIYGFNELCRLNSQGDNQGVGKRLSEIDVQELIYYCGNIPMVSGSSIYHPVSIQTNYRQEDKPRISITAGEFHYGWVVDPNDNLDFTNLYTSDVGRHAQKTLYRDIFTVWCILNGRDYEFLRDAIIKSDSTSPKVYIQRAVSRSAIKALLEIGVLNDDTLGRYLESAQQLMYEEAANEIFRKANNRAGMICFETGLYSPFIDDSSSEMWPDERFIPYMMRFLKSFFENIEGNVQKGTIVPLPEILSAIVNTRIYIEKLLKIYEITQTSELLPSMIDAYNYLAKRHKQLNHQGEQLLLDRRDEKI